METAYERGKGETNLLWLSHVKRKKTKSKRLLKTNKTTQQEIKNLKTALINVHELKYGLDLLPQLGKTCEKMNYEQRAREKEKQFVKEYLSKK